MAFYNFIGSLILSIILKTLKIGTYTLTKKSNIILVNLLSIASVLSLTIAYFIYD